MEQIQNMNYCTKIQSVKYSELQLKFTLFVLLLWCESNTIWT